MKASVKTKHPKKALSKYLILGIKYRFGFIATMIIHKLKIKGRTFPKKISKEILILLWLLIFGFIIIAVSNLAFLKLGYSQFSSMADSFLHGKLFLLQNAHSYYDAAFFKGHYYWPLGPFPSVILLPFVFFFGNSFKEGYLFPVLILAIFIVTYLLGVNITRNKISAFWLSFGYIFSTAFIGVALVSASWQFAQLIQNLLIFLAILGVFKKWHFFIIGFLLACAIATRIDMVVATAFFIAIIFLDKVRLNQKIKNTIYLLMPIFVSFMLLGIYNYFRFENIFEQGYSFQKLYFPELIANRAAGLWSFIHFPANLYYFFLRGPDPVLIKGSQILIFPFIQSSQWGMSIFITSPIFLGIFKASWKNRFVFSSAITSLLIFIAVMGYYGIGFMQYGYRYALDFYPFLFVILLFAVKKSFPIWLKFIIFITFFTNLYLSRPH